MSSPFLRCILAYCCLFPLSLFAQDIQFRVDGLKKPVTVAIGAYYAGIPSILDSARLDSTQPLARFKVQQPLASGQYFLGIPGADPFDIVVHQENTLHFATHAATPLDSFKVLVSAENQGYWYWQKYMRARRNLIEQQQATLNLIRRATKDKAVLDAEAKKIREMEEDMTNFTREQLVKYPNLFFPKLVNATAPTKVLKGIPPFIDDKVNIAYVRYYKSHFWDNFDFRDERLLRSKALPEKIDDWLAINGQPLDTAKRAVDMLVRKVQPYADMRKAAVQHLVQRFEDINLTNGDAMFVHMFDRYLNTATKAGVDTFVWMRMEYKAKIFRPNLIGQKAPEIKLPNHRDSIVSLHGFNAPYTLVYFFSPLCKKCQEITPGFYALTQQYAAKGLKVIAVTTECPKAYWQDYVQKNVPNWTSLRDEARPSPLNELYAISGLPNLYCLDKDKKIVTKRIPWERVQEFLDAWVK